MNEDPRPSEAVVLSAAQSAVLPSTDTMINPPAHTPSSDVKISQIPIEIISEDEMALIEAAFSAAACTQFHRNSRSIRSISLLSKRGISACTSSGSPDIEDSGRVVFPEKNKRNREVESFLQQFRRGRGLSVTDITGTEWCEKQMEYILLFGKPKRTKAMKAGSARHVILEEEVIKRVKVQVESAEDSWALKFMNFIVGVNQLLFEGLTRELPLVGFVEGVWMVGIIDEIRMPDSESPRFPTLVDTKTRVRATLPGEPQKRNGRLQLMCYKYMWDTLVADKFPARKFYDFFSLNPNLILSPEIRENTAKSGLPSETLNDVVRCFQNSCSLLPHAHDQLLLRYELQEDQSLLGEDEFSYEHEWLKEQIKSCLEFWMGQREASYTPEAERWKCKFCKFAPVCPAISSPDGSPSRSNSGPNASPGKTNSGPNTSPGKTNSGPNANSGPNTSPGKTNSGPNTSPGKTNSGPNANSGPNTSPGKSNSGPNTSPGKSNSGPNTSPGKTKSGDISP